MRLGSESLATDYSLLARGAIRSELNLNNEMDMILNLNQPATPGLVMNVIF